VAAREMAASAAARAARAAARAARAAAEEGVSGTRRQDLH